MTLSDWTSVTKESESGEFLSRKEAYGRVQRKKKHAEIAGSRVAPHFFFLFPGGSASLIQYRTLLHI